VQYLNNVLEQDHRAIKRRVRASQHLSKGELCGIEGISQCLLPMEKRTGEPASQRTKRNSAKDYKGLNFITPNDGHASPGFAVSNQKRESERFLALNTRHLRREKFG
jgi:hypothetical protein